MLGGMTDSDIAPDVGQLVRVRGQQWVVNRRSVSTQPRDELAAELPGRSLVTLTSVSDDDLGDELTVAWEIEPGREVLPATRLPAVTETGWDDPQTLGAFLDAVRWGTVASADDHTLQAPFRAGITIEDYQLEPVAKALGMPRVNLLIADDVGLGKTIEAGLVVQEMLLRNRARRVLVVCPAPLIGKWRDEMAEKFGLEFTILDAPALKVLRRTHGLEANPFSVFPRTILSLPWLRTPRVQRLLDEVLVPEARHPGFFDVLVVDEAHHCAPPAPASGKRYALDSLQTQAVRRVGDFSQHRLFLSATPHNGYPESWQALLEMLDPRRFARGVEPDPVVVQQVMVRRLKDELTLPDGSARFPGRQARAIEVTYTDDERVGHDLLTRYTHSRQTAPGAAAVRAGDLISLLLKKRLFSSPAAFARTLAAHQATLCWDRCNPTQQCRPWRPCGRVHPAATTPHDSPQRCSSTSSGRPPRPCSSWGSPYTPNHPSPPHSPRHEHAEWKYAWSSNAPRTTPATTPPTQPRSPGSTPNGSAGRAHHDPTAQRCTPKSWSSTTAPPSERTWSAGCWCAEGPYRTTSAATSKDW